MTNNIQITITGGDLEHARFLNAIRAACSALASRASLSDAPGALIKATVMETALAAAYHTVGELLHRMDLADFSYHRTETETLTVTKAERHAVLAGLGVRIHDLTNEDRDAKSEVAFREYMQTDGHYSRQSDNEQRPAFVAQWRQEQRDFLDGLRRVNSLFVHAVEI